jgi:hypothetical protein
MNGITFDFIILGLFSNLTCLLTSINKCKHKFYFKCYLITYKIYKMTFKI